MDAFSGRLRNLRSQKGLSQVQMADLVETTPRVYNRWERGTALPRLDAVVKIADILQVSLDELVGRVEPKPPQIAVRNPKLHAMYRQLDRLTPEDQQAAIVLLDSLLKRSEMGRVLAG